MWVNYILKCFKFIFKRIISALIYWQTYSAAISNYVWTKNGNITSLWN